MEYWESNLSEEIKNCSPGILSKDSPGLGLQSSKTFTCLCFFHFGRSPGSLLNLYKILSFSLPLNLYNFDKIYLKKSKHKKSCSSSLSSPLKTCLACLSVSLLAHFYSEEGCAFSDMHFSLSPLHIFLKKFQEKLPYFTTERKNIFNSSAYTP